MAILCIMAAFIARSKKGSARPARFVPATLFDHEHKRQQPTPEARMALHWPLPGRARRGGGRRSARAGSVLLRLYRRRHLEDHRRWAVLAKHFGWLFQARLGR